VFVPIFTPPPPPPLVTEEPVIVDATPFPPLEIPFVLPICPAPPPPPELPLGEASAELAPAYP
jgi:hypothetical protein